MFYTYIFYSQTLQKYCKDHFNNLDVRIKQHNQVKSRHISSGIPWVFILAIEKPTRKEAAVLERKLKNLNRERLEAFILKYKDVI
jgi:putative endonuclease